MLKPRKKITRKEIKKDPVLERVVTTYSFIQDKQKLLTKIGIGIVIGFVLFNIWNNHVHNKNEESSYIFSKALVAWQTGDVDNALLHFETLTDDFDGTDNGKIARYWLGLIAYNTGDLVSSTKYLKQFVKFGKADILLPNAFQLLANLSLNDENYKIAHTYFKKAIKYSMSEIEEMTHKLNLAEFYLIQKREKDAEAIIVSILDTKDISSSLKTRAEELSGKLKS
ncbi:MAG TPA: tetratricopeptide repeat protein [Candidatus Marinimicrobia bacterium]|jgi:TolA-binding protein|nr:tetratricopeptide repeat protein [Candidatus Neomarinimicrobiota bacterium]|tara:strand:- start:10726 stop:11400 length:675 start_codon:yes stop_codon:yes gene_type:complete